MLGNFACFYVVCHFFFKFKVLKNSYRNMIRVSNSLEPDQAKHYVRPDLFVLFDLILYVPSTIIQL